MRRPRGFTLIEVIVALTIAGIVVLGAQRIFAGVADGARALTAARAQLDCQANARRWLKSTFLSLEPPFNGRTNRVSFTSWQLTAGGWFVPRYTALSLAEDRFVASAGEQSLLLAGGMTDVWFDYLLDPGANSKWVREWVSPVSAPLAIRIRLSGCGRADRACVDTLLFLVKERG